MKFWDVDTEISFFKKALAKANFASPEKIFYKLSEGYFAYIPKGINTEKQTLQSRNSLIGGFTEKWVKDFFQPIADKLNLFALNKVVCPELGLTKESKADLAFCTTDQVFQKAENIKLIFEIKMSIVNNYKYNTTTKEIIFFGDYKTHKGTPSILRSDSMLKAIGKSINVRIAGYESSKIPIVVIGNSPITEYYLKKVDFLKKAGIIQSFISLYPNPTDEFIKESYERGFQTFENYERLFSFIKDLVELDLNFFSSMLPKKRLGEIIKISAQEKEDVLRAEKFLSLIKKSNE